MQPIRTIFLVGFMGAGKTSVGQALAKKLNWLFEDLDDRIQRHAGRTISEIFEKSGEAEFRNYETLSLREILSEPAPPPRIIALGGGSFVQGQNAALLRQSGATSIFLNAPLEELYRRCQQQDVKRPLRQDEEQFRKLYESRHSFYVRDTIQIETAGKTISAIADELCELFGLEREAQRGIET